MVDQLERKGSWSGREDSNLRPPGPEPGALARLSHAPNIFSLYDHLLFAASGAVMRCLVQSIQLLGQTGHPFAAIDFGQALLFG
jgi:hypothetical protein